MRLLLLTVLFLSSSLLAVAQRIGREEAPPTRTFEPVSAEFDAPSDSPLREYAERINRKRQERLMEGVVSKNETERKVEDTLATLYEAKRTEHKLPQLKRFRTTEMHDYCTGNEAARRIAGLLAVDVFDAPNVETAEVVISHLASVTRPLLRTKVRDPKPQRFALEVCEMKDDAGETFYRVVVGQWLGFWDYLRDATPRLRCRWPSLCDSDGIFVLIPECWAENN